jgi:hypothetical protein
MTSRYDSIYDRFSDVASSKTGTKYERLVAFVLRVLREHDAVIHDIKLIGDSEVKHQIDVTLLRSGQSARTLVECKDFDVSGKPVGLPIIRDFSAVVDDTHPDEALVITCNAFTEDARKFAKAKGIKLAVLRQFEDSDWKGRVKTIEITFQVMSITEPSVELRLSADANLHFQAELQAIGATGRIVGKRQPVYVHHHGNRQQIAEFVQDLANGHPREEEGSVRMEVRDVSLEVSGNPLIPVEALVICFDVYHDHHSLKVTSDKVAELLLQGLSGSDIIIFDQDLQRLAIDPETGEIVPA